jgi:hypothetical protein
MTPPPNDAVIPPSLPILSVLPPMIVRALQRHFYAGVKMAEVRFRHHEADEDAVTGALGERLIEPAIRVQFGPEVFTWSTVYYKLRGRGAHAPEKELGADGIFQLEVLDQEKRFILRKGLLFQSKIEWTGRDERLFYQAQRLAAVSRSAIVIDYSSNGYKAIPATSVMSAEGNRQRIPPENDKPLAEVLGDEFVGCLLGDHGLYWEPKLERLVVDNEGLSDIVPEHFIGTTMERLQ